MFFHTFIMMITNLTLASAKSTAIIASLHFFDQFLFQIIQLIILVPCKFIVFYFYFYFVDFLYNSFHHGHQTNHLVLTILLIITISELFQQLFLIHYVSSSCFIIIYFVNLSEMIFHMNLVAITINLLTIINLELHFIVLTFIITYLQKQYIHIHLQQSTRYIQYLLILKFLQIYLLSILIKLKEI